LETKLKRLEMLNILDWWRGRTPVGRTATEIYGSIVADARNPIFYTEFGVPDVAERRYEMIVLHLLVALERVRKDSEPRVSDELAQALIEAFVRDLDGSIREMAVGDTKVPAKVKKAAGGLLDRDVLYREAFAHEQTAQRSETSTEDTLTGNSGNDGLTRANLLNELIYEGNGGKVVEALVGYVEAARMGLNDWQPLAGSTRVPFPDPAPFIERDA